MSFSVGNGTPMMPVEDGKTSSKTQPNWSPTAMQLLRQASRPACPVAQLALPALTMSAETLPPVAARCLRPMVTGAATTWLRVNRAAAVAPPVQMARATSGLPLALMPALTEDH